MRLLFAVLYAADSFTDELAHVGRRLIERPDIPIAVIGAFAYMAGELGFETMVFALLLAIYAAVIEVIGGQEATHD